MSQPAALLTPYRALDLCDASGMICGRIFGDMGADVIKVEKPGGDADRRTGPYFHDQPGADSSLPWLGGNVSKRAVTLDLTHPAGKELFLKLAASADFVFETQPPGYLDGLGLGYGALSRVNPAVILTSITPFGQRGPYRDFKSSDLIAATHGAMQGTGYPGRAPLRFAAEQGPPQAGAQAAAATMIALHHRLATGEGQHVDFSIQEAMLQTIMSIAQRWELAGDLFVRAGIKFPRGHLTTRCIYDCRDGYVAWELWVADQGTKTNAIVAMMREWHEDEADVAHLDFTAIDMNDVTAADLEKWEEAFNRFFSRYTKAELHREAIKRDIMLYPVNTIADLFNDDQLQARDFWQTVPHPHLEADIVFPGAPFKSNVTATRISGPAPGVGEHNDAVFGDLLGLAPDKLGELAAQGVI